VSHDLERIIRDSYEAYNRGDFDEAARAMHPEIEWDSGETSLMGDTVRGPGAVVERLKPDVFESQRGDLLGVEIKGDRAFIELHFHAVGSGSGLKLMTQAWQVWTFREGLVVRVQNFMEREQARTAAGLEASRAQ
jgi:ketosteroid isomerase-like protein